jgi:hypothetical protein
MGAEEPPFSKGTLVAFRARLIARDLDRQMVERTVELAVATGGCARPGRDRGAAGAGQAAGPAAVAALAGVPQPAASSFRAALDADWDDSTARDAALAQVLGILHRVGAFGADHAGDEAVAAGLPRTSSPSTSPPGS